ncbi:MAG TPA: [LysW]-lysine hydrolase [Anaerolineae bacterium]|nr:[LysW]-lysine hydrolase [Anaerolineae bacterium]
MNDERAVGLLQEMLEIYSPSTQEGELAEYLVAAMAERGFRAYRDGAGNAVGELGDGERQILLLGHIDTVPGFIPVRIEGEIIYGRGAVDAKGPLAAFVAAAARVGPLPGKRIVVVGAVEEEAATSKGARYLLDKFSPDCVVIGEPSRWDRVTLGYKGRLLVDYALEQERSHTAGPRVGVCEAAVKFWQGVKDYARKYNRGKERMFERLDPSLRRIHSGGDGFSERVEATVALRLPPGLDAETLKDAIEGLAGEARLTFYAGEAPFRAFKNTPLARAFLASIREHGGQPRFVLKSGTSDMNVVGPIWGCPIVAYGPGDSSLDHTPHEHLSLTEYGRAVKVLECVLRGV